MSGRLALGLGDNTDYEIRWDSAVFESLIDLYGIKSAELNENAEIVDERSLVVSILSHLKKGAGGESFVRPLTLTEEFSNRFEKTITLGGTPVRAAIAMSRLGHGCALHLVTMNEHVRRLLPPDCEYICSGKTESSYPHLIVQYGGGTRVMAGDIDITAPRANRVIYDNNPDYISMELDARLPTLLSRAEVFLISGFNAMQSAALLQNRLNSLNAALDALPENAQVYYEDAGFFDRQLRDTVGEALRGRVTIHGMNEDELEEYCGEPLELLSVDSIIPALRKAAGVMDAELVVVHTRYWALAFGKNAKRLKNALNGGIMMAVTRFCHGDDFTAADYERSALLPENAEGAAFAEKISAALGENVRCLPCRVSDETRATTIGLGDAFVGGFLPLL